MGTAAARAGPPQQPPACREPAEPRRDPTLCVSSASRFGAGLLASRVPLDGMVGSEGRRLGPSPLQHQSGPRCRRAPALCAEEGVREPLPAAAASPCVLLPAWILLPLREAERAGVRGERQPCCPPPAAPRPCPRQLLTSHNLDSAGLGQAVVPGIASGRWRSPGPRRLRGAWRGVHGTRCTALAPRRWVHGARCGAGCTVCSVGRRVRGVCCTARGAQRGVRGARGGAHSAGCRVRGVERGARGALRRARSAGCRLRGAGCGARGAFRRVRGAGRGCGGGVSPSTCCYGKRCLH